MKTDHVINLCTVVAVCFFFIGIFVGVWMYETESRRSAIAAGVAYYNPTNAHFQWIDVDKLGDK